MTTIVCCHQPNFFPYMGLFDKVRQSDIFVIQDTYQFEKWVKRNRIKLMESSKAKWLTIPLQKGYSTLPIREILLGKNLNWKRKHLNTLYQNYHKAMYFDEYFTEIKKKVYDIESNKLIDYNIASIQLILGIFNIECEQVLTSELDIPSGLSTTEKLIKTTKLVGGDVYLSGISGDNYLDKAMFKEVKLKIQKFNHLIYKQLGKGFLKNLSIIDYLFNVGNLQWWKD